MKYSILMLILSIFLIGVVNAGNVDVTLNSPADSSISFINPTTFNVSANVSGGSFLKNISLFTNITGSWLLTNTTSFEIGIPKNYFSPSLSPTSGGGNFTGVKIVVGDSDIVINTLSKIATDDSTISYILYGGNLSVIKGVPWISNNATFNQTLQSGETYYLVAGQNSGNYGFTTSVTYPIVVNGGDFNVTSGRIVAGDTSGQWASISAIYYTNSSQLTSINEVWNLTLPSGATKWNVNACDTDSNCSFASSNFTVSLDATPPSITITSPNTTIELLNQSKELNLNFTITDDNLNSCWYNYNGINNSLPSCANTTFNYIFGNNEITIWANDSAGNINFSTKKFYYKVFENSAIFTTPGLSGSFQDFSINIGTNNSITSAYLFYNNTLYLPSIDAITSTNYTLSNTIQVPSVNTIAFIDFYWIINLQSGDSINTSLNNQTIQGVNLDNCGVYSYPMFNLSLFDERTLSPINGTIQFNLDLLNPDGSLISNLATNNTNVHSVNYCSDTQLNNTNYFYNLELRYYSNNGSTSLYSPEFYHIQNASTQNFVQNINLYDLNVNESTIFTLNYRNNNYIAESNVLLQIMRKYVDEGIFRVVEIPITSNQGQAIAHFDINNYKYKIIATKNGIVQNVFDNPSIRCESELSGICTINLNGKASPKQYQSVKEIEDFEYSLSLNNQTITFSYSIPSSATSNITIVMMQTSPFTNPTQICYTSFIAAGGGVDCDVNSTIGDSKVTITIIKNGIVFGQFYVDFQEDLESSWFLNNYIIAALLLIILVTMFVSSPQLMIVSSVFGVIYLAFIFLLKSYSIGVVLGAIVWLIFSAIIVIYKLNLKEET